MTRMVASRQGQRRMAQQNILGATGKDPRWAMAYQIPARTGGNDAARDIVGQVGRTGVATDSFTGSREAFGEHHQPRHAS